MARFKDIAGQRFGQLVAAQPTERRIGASVVWECRCDCGDITYVRSSDLINGHTKSCGCFKSKDISGKRFGQLTAIRPTAERRKRSVVWECICDCGKTTFVPENSLTIGNTNSCGCLSRRAGKDLTGQKFGKLSAIRPTDKRSGGGIVWECQCDCGNITFVTVNRLSNNRTKSCGCLASRPKISDNL